jgi:two-component system catabolic regulation response regulator CreB
MSQATVIVVEDEPAIADTVIYALESEGYMVHWCKSGLAAVEQTRMSNPDLVILDIGLPDANGFDVFRQLRAISEVPVIFLTARNVEIDRVTGLEMGADDYVVKPFSPRELTARVGAVLRRTQSSSASGGEDGFEAGPFAVDKASWTIRYRDVELDLTRHEFEILSILVASPERVYSRENLLQMIWEAPDHRLSRTVDAHIKNLRAKLRAIDPGTDPIKTRRGVGYFASWPK